jgi:hypothetical protein
VVNEPAGEETAPPPPGTLSELLDDARVAGWAKANERLLRRWYDIGLLGSPERRPLEGGGSGQQPGLYSSQQRVLFGAMVRIRVQSASTPSTDPFPAHKDSALASIPVYAWLHFGSDWVDNHQLKKALKLALGPNPRKSLRAAKLAATQFVNAIDVNDAPLHARNSLRDFIADQLWHGRHVDLDALRARITAVVEPQGLAVVRGPVDSTMMINSLVYAVQARLKAADSINAITDEQLGIARLRYNAGRPAYEAWNARLQDNLAPGLARMFNDVGPDNEIREAVPAVLLLLGMDLLQHEDQTP